MANTMSKYGSNTNRPLSEIVGLSTDTKPTDSIEGIKIQNGSSFRELDTGKKFLFDAENTTWNEVSSGGGGGGFTPTTEQLAAMNSGITSEDVAQIETNENNISSFYPTAYQSLEPAVNDVTVLSGGYIQIGNVIIISARISITSDQTGNIFHNMPNAATTAALGQAVAPINATAVSASTNDTNLIFLNSDVHKGVIAVAGNHTKISAGTYVISGMYLLAD